MKWGSLLQFSRSLLQQNRVPRVATSHRQEILALCLRIVIAIINYEREDDPESEKLKL